MVPHCHEICKRHLCYMHLGKRNKFSNSSSYDLISNNCNQFLTYLGTTHLSPLTIYLFIYLFVFYFFANEKTDKNVFKISLYRTYYVIEIQIILEINFPLKLSPKVVVCIFLFYSITPKNHH